MDAPKPLNEVVLPQRVVGPLTRAAIFLPVASARNKTTMRRCGPFSPVSGLVRAVEFRDVEAGLTCVVAIRLRGLGPTLWFASPRGTSSFPGYSLRICHAVSTPGDIFFHIRAKRPDLCFELATQLMDSIGETVSVADEVHGFRYFDDRDVMGFVDGTENPRGGCRKDAAVVGDEDPAFAGGSYVIVQKYLHDMKGWNALPVETQERIIGRKKLSDIELSEAEKPTTRTMRSRSLSRMEKNSRFCGTTCLSAGPVTASSAPTSSVIAALRASPRRCCKICSSAVPRAITTVCWISATPSPAIYFLCPRRRFSTTSAETPPLRRHRTTPTSDDFDLLGARPSNSE